MPTRAVDSRSSTTLPLCIDLDGTLLKTDLLWEETLSLIKKNPVALLSIPFWLLSGRAHLKRRIGHASQLDVTTLPYRAEVLELIQRARDEGRRTVLVSAADQGEAERIAAHLGCFDEVIGSDGQINLKGKTKSALLEKRFGHKGFDYAGDHPADLHVWRAARAGIIVSGSKRLLRRAGLVTAITPLSGAPARPFQTLLRALRIHQWSKNILVAVPIVTSHQLTDPRVLLAGITAFFAFCLVSSGTYLVNDLLDLEADRGHRTKKMRAFSSGAIGLQRGILLALSLLCAGFALSLVAGTAFMGILAGYCAVSLTYSAFLKRIALLDVLILAGLYTLRIFAGGAGASIEVSLWLLAFSMFFFFSLALMKRYSELRLEVGGGKAQIGGRGYISSDLPHVAMFGIASGFVSVLVLVLYIRSPEVTLLYRQPSLLLLIGPLLLYWISRVWMLSSRGLVAEDPVVFALTDKISYVVGVGALLVIYLASF